MSSGGRAAPASASSSRGAGGEIVILARGALMPLVYERLSNALGPRRAGEVARAALGLLDERMIDEPNDLLALAEVLVKYGGLVEAVGRSLKVQAILRGAVAT
jgi:hypothetical protein